MNSQAYFFSDSLPLTIRKSERLLCELWCYLYPCLNCLGPSASYVAHPGDDTMDVVLKKCQSVWRLVFVKETLKGFKPCGAFTAPITNLLILTASSHLNLTTCEGEAFSDGGKYFLSKNQHAHLCLTASFGCSWTCRTFAQSPDVGCSAEVLQVWDSPPEFSLRVLYSLNTQLVQQAAWNPSCLLSLSSPSFDWQGKTPTAPF